MEQTSYYGAPGREVRFAADSPVEEAGFELFVLLGISASPSWWSRARKPHGAPERSFSVAGPIVRIHLPPPASRANFQPRRLNRPWGLSATAVHGAPEGSFSVAGPIVRPPHGETNEVFPALRYSAEEIARAEATARA